MDGHLKSYPLSIAQHGMWIKEKFAQADFSFILAEALEIHGPVSPSVFCKALEQLSHEAEATRLRIVVADDGPRQIVGPYSSRSLEIVDLSGKTSPLEEAFAWMRKEIGRQHDLAGDGLWFNALIKIGEEHWIWYHRVHHILFDGFSGGLLARRQAEIYTAMMRAEDAGACEFGALEDLAEKEGDYRRSAHFERDRAYWLEQMKDLPAPATLTRVDTPPSGGFLREHMTIRQSDIAALQTEAKNLGASFPQVLIALVAAYYARATDSDDLTMVTMVTGRISSAMRRIPGMVANAVPLRFKITPDLTWRDLVRQASGQMARALRYQRYRYEDLRRDLDLVGPQEHIARLGVNIEPFNYDLRFDGHSTTAHNLSNGTMTDFTVFAYDRGDGNDLHIHFDANPALYTLADLRDHKKRFQHLITEILANPERPFRELSLLTPEDRQQVLIGWNDTDISIPEQTWLDLFSRQALLRPDAVAVVFEERSLTYAALDRASDDCAALLQEHGIGPGQLVAIGLPRCEKMLIAILAVLKVGAAYIPLDPADPAERISNILTDGRPSLVLCSTVTSASIPQVGIERLILDAEPLSRKPNRPAPTGPTADDTAYVIFTSGSTGRPKGVEIAHRSLLNFLHAMQSELQLTSSDRIVAVTTIAFDIATLELFLPLTVGAATVIATRETVRDPGALHRLIKRESVTLMQATPSLWRMLLSDHSDALRGLRPLVGGEALAPDLAHRMRTLGHPVINLYGPTETTVWSTSMRLEGADLDTVPIGRPIANTQVYVLDGMLQPVPPGMIGELYIAGAGVAKGYLNNPDLTAERFLPNPFTNGDGRIYRTGDLARWRSDGLLEYMGRNDHQIKIRGFRVEPGEIEAALMSIDAVRQSVVVLRDDGSRGKQLVAYLVVSTTEPLDTAKLSKQLAATLPVHMIPAAYVFLDALPLNTNGKIDRSALPAPQQQMAVAHVPPGTATEILIADIWCQILALDTVSIHDNFFELGGDSLSAAAMMSALGRKTDLQIGWSTLFEAPTIANFAHHLDRPDQHKSALEPVLPIRSKGHQPPLFCIHPILGIGWAFSALAQHIHESIPIHAIQADGVNDSSLAPQSIEEMAESYLLRMREIQPRGPYSILGWSFGGLVAHEISRLIEQEGEEIAFLGLLDAYPFLPPTGPAFHDESVLARAALGFLGFDESALGHQPAFLALGDFLVQEYKQQGNSVLEQIAGDDSGLIDRLRTLILHHLDIAQRFVPRRLRANLHFFSAQPASSNTIHDILNYQVGAWQPHVGGTIHVHDMQCAHEDMMMDREAAKIAGIFMEQALRRVQAGLHAEAPADALFEQQAS